MKEKKNDQDDRDIFLKKYAWLGMSFDGNPDFDNFGAKNGRKSKNGRIISTIFLGKAGAGGAREPPGTVPTRKHATSLSLERD